MQKITNSQIDKLKKEIVKETINGLHKLCTKSQSGTHDWRHVVKKGWVRPKLYYKHKRCANCKMWKDKAIS